MITEFQIATAPDFTVYLNNMCDTSTLSPNLSTFNDCVATKLQGDGNAYAIIQDAATAYVNCVVPPSQVVP
jgi:hypothetical protein